LLIGYLTGANSSRCRCGHSVGQEDADGGNLSRYLDCAAGLVIYGPILIAQLSEPSIAVKIEGINYFADTLLFGAGAILALASADATHGSERFDAQNKLNAPAS